MHKELSRKVLVPGSLQRRLFNAQVASCSCQTKTHEPDAHKLECRYRILKDAHRRLDVLESALRFYASGGHAILDKDAWDTVSGEPQNFWCDESGTDTVEDGTIAKRFLLGEWKEWGEEGAPDYIAEELAELETGAANE